MADFSDDFGDDDLDLLPDNAFQELENKARLSTQHHASGQAANTLPGELEKKALIARTNHGAVQSTEEAGESDYDVFDLDVQPSFVADQYRAQQSARDQDPATAREQWRVQRYGNTQQHTIPAPHTVPYPRMYVKPRPIHVPMEVDEPPQGHGNVDVSALQARISELERHEAALRKAADNAKSAALSKNGEIAIVRANQQKEAKEYEQKLKALQQQHAEEAAKTKAEIEAIRKEREKYETSNRFLEHDLAREAGRARNSKNTLKDGAGNALGKGRDSVMATPRKNKAMPLRDGFDDDEVVRLSPSKGRDRSKGSSTPKAGGKRKRAQEESIAGSPALSFAEPEPVPIDEDVHMVSQPSAQPSLPQALDLGEEKVEFMQAILDHRSAPGRGRTIEVLGVTHLRSNPSSSLAAGIYDRLNIPAARQDLDQFRRELCEVLISQWTRCLAEEYYDPLHDLTELLQFILIISPEALSTSLISHIVPLCQQTADKIPIAFMKAGKDSSAVPLPSRGLRQQIDPAHYLDILYLLATNSLSVSVSAGSESVDLINFWSQMEFDFVLLLVHPIQPLSQIMSMLRLLYTSVLPATFGSIFPDQARQSKMESDIVDRLSGLLFDTPKQLQNAQKPKYLTDFLRKKTPEEVLEEQPIKPYTEVEILLLHSEVLGILQALASDDHGGQLLAIHQHAIPRLVRALHESVVNMYTSYTGTSYPTPTNNDRDDTDERLISSTTREPPSAHELHASHVNMIVTILFQLASAHGTLATLSSSGSNGVAAANNGAPAPFNIPELLAPLPCGLQRYQVALSRIAFSEPWGMEALIEADVAEMAHELLDEAVSPVEGAAVLSVFGSGRVNLAA